MKVTTGPFQIHSAPVALFPRRFRPAAPTIARRSDPRFVGGDRRLARGRHGSGGGGNQDLSLGARLWTFPILGLRKTDRHWRDHRLLWLAIRYTRLVKAALALTPDGDRRHHRAPRAGSLHLAPGPTRQGVAVLMCMHLAIALVTYNALVRIAPTHRFRRQARTRST